MGNSFYSMPQQQAATKCCCFFKTLESPLGSKACSVLTAAAIQSCLHRTSICQCEKAPSWTKDWPTVCWQGLLTKTTFQHSAVSPFTLAFCSNIHSSSRSTDRGSTALACHTALSLLSRGGAGWHWHSPLSQVQAATTQKPNSSSRHTGHSAHNAPSQHLVIIMCHNLELNIHNSLHYNKWKIKLVLTNQITNYTLLFKERGIIPYHCLIGFLVDQQPLSTSHKIIIDKLTKSFPKTNSWSVKNLYWPFLTLMTRGVLEGIVVYRAATNSFFYYELICWLFSRLLL